jgi:hypothetical protein
MVLLGRGDQLAVHPEMVWLVGAEPTQTPVPEGESLGLMQRLSHMGGFL